MAACSLQLIITVPFQKSVLAMLLTEYGGKLFKIHWLVYIFPTGSMRKVCLDRVSLKHLQLKHYACYYTLYLWLII